MSRKSLRHPDHGQLHPAVDRRSFVKTTGGILVAAGLGTACAGTDPSTTGKVIVNITGLAPGLTDGGTAVISRTDVATQLPLSVLVPPGGQGEGDVPAGTYHVIYTPPVGYQVVGLNEFDVTVKPLETQNVDVEVAFIVVTMQGTISVQVSGLTVAATGGGSASLQRTDLAGQNPIAVVVPVAGQVDTVVTAGTYTVTYTAPANFTVSGNAVKSGLVVAANATVPASFAVTANGAPAFVPGDIVDNASFENDFDGFVTGSFKTPTNVTRDTKQSRIGTTSIRRDMTTSTLDTNGDFHYPFYSRNGQNGYVANGQGVDRLFTRFWFKVDQTFNGTIFKLQMFQQAGFSKFSEFGFFQNFLTMNFQPEWGGGVIRLASLASINDGKWHSLECDMQYNGNTDAGGDYTSAKIWLDDVDVSIAAPPPVGGQGNVVLGAWVNGRINVGSRTAYNTGKKIGVFSILNILNANNPVVGNVWVDNVAISTLGRVGP